MALFPYLLIPHGEECRVLADTAAAWQSLGLPPAESFFKRYVMGAHFYFSLYLEAKGLPFSFFEDAAGALSRPDQAAAILGRKFPQHAELAWVLNCYTMFGELSRMTQFKDKSATHADNVNAGLFTYPTLMAADILLYQADLVPVGEDQRQHVEITRNIAQRFNGIYGDVFTMPEAYIPEVAARVMSLSEPDKKVSKSSPNENSYILVMDKPEVILRKFKRAVTDSEGGIYRSPDKPGVTNLIEIYAAVTGTTPEAVESEFAGKGYGDFKPAVGEAVIETLRPIREETERLLADKGYLESLYRQGAEKAAAIANRTLRKVHKKVGFAPR